MKLTTNEKIRVIMRRRGVSVQELGEKLGKTRQAVNQKLNKGMFTIDDLEKYAAALGCSVKVEIIEPPEGGSSDTESINK